MGVVSMLWMLGNVHRCLTDVAEIREEGAVEQRPPGSRRLRTIILI